MDLQTEPLSIVQAQEDDHYSIGSVWRRWDLHIHTPTTALNNQFEGGFEEYITALESNHGVVALGITEYLTVEGYKKIYEIKQAGQLANIDLILPNIEFRISPETQYSKGVNIHLLVAPEQPNHIEEIEAALSRLAVRIDSRNYSCTYQDLLALGRKHLGDESVAEHIALEKGTEQFKISFDKFREWFDGEPWLKKNSLVAVANSSKDGASGIREDGFQEIRQEIYRFANMIFSGNPSDCQFWLGKGTDKVDDLNRKAGGVKPCLHGSDAHSLDKLFRPDNDRYCWIKADPTFEGLRQVLYEPEERVYIGPSVPDSRNHSQIITSITVNNSKWFENSEIRINPGLVAIIGSKGSGKTALADFLAYGSNAWDSRDEGSFIKRAKEYITGTLLSVEWMQGGRTEYDIDLRRKIEAKPLVRYLSQQFVERLCSQDYTGNDLKREIENVIFASIEKIETLGAANFSELLTKKTAFIKETQNRVREQIREINRKIDALEIEKASIPEKTERIKAIDEEKNALRKQLPSLNTQEEEFAAKLKIAREKQIELVKQAGERKSKLALINDVRYKVKNFQDVMSRHFEELQEQLREVGITEDLIANFTPKYQGDIEAPLAGVERIAEEEVDKINGPKDGTVPETLNALKQGIAKLEQDLSSDKAKKDRYNELQSLISKLEQEQVSLKSAIEKFETKTQADLQNLNSERYDAYLSYLDSLNQEQKILEELYESLRKRLSDDKAEDCERQLEFYIKWNFDLDKWIEQGWELLNQRKKRDFPLENIDELKSEIEKLVGGKWRNIRLDELKEDLRIIRGYIVGEHPPNELLKPKVSSVEFEDWFYSFDHISLFYGLRYGGVDLEKLSPGTKGLVLLILYLEMDQDDTRPLIVDQPEENLDNASIFEVLTAYFRKAKKRRQIILITHNPNLVVNTDAEQVIIAERSGQDGNVLFTYRTGSLENIVSIGEKPGIRQTVCQILEGGETAFHKREQKYSLQK